ncbi:MAG: conjugal transfer protein TraX [Saccharofermentans sp.]|nr:conjugal transfer protein TraX [Saccharofermentans sp.]
MFIGHFFTFTIKELHFLGLPSVLVNMVLWFMYIAPPIFMFFISEGFVYTRDRKKYIIRLLIVGVVTQFAFVLGNAGAMDWYMFSHSGNVILTLLISLLILMIYESKLNVFLRAILALALIGFTYLWKMEWGVVAPLVVFSFYAFRNKPVWRFVIYDLIMVGYTVISMGMNVPFLLVVQIPIIMVTFFYNGKKGRFPRFSRNFFYIFYPAHMLFIFLIKVLFKA